MSDRVINIFEGAGTALHKTYTAGLSGNTDGYDVSAYEQVTLKLKAEVSGAGVARVTCEFSDDDTTYCAPRLQTPETAAYASVSSAQNIDAAGNWAFTWNVAGKFVKFTIAYVSGTSVTVSLTSISARS